MFEEIMRFKDEKANVPKVRNNSKLIENNEDKDDRYTKLLKLKGTRRHLKRGQFLKERLKKCLQDKLIVSLIRLKDELSNQRLDYLCHLEERKKRKENYRKMFIKRLFDKYEIPDDSLPYDHPIFDRIIMSEKEWKKEKCARKRRTIEIIEKISREMNGRCIKLMSKIRKFRSNDERHFNHSFFDNSIESTKFEFQRDAKKQTKAVTCTENLKILEYSEVKVTEDEKKGVLTKPKENISMIEGLDVIHIEKTRNLRLNDDFTFAKDYYFYASPDQIEFKDFQIGKTYYRKVNIFNKSSNWAYIRFHKIETETWEPVIEVNMESAVKLKPGLYVKIIIKFMPINEEEVIAIIHFLTFGPDNPTKYHRFSLPIHCSPEIAIPVIDPQEIRFVTSPIWKFTDPKLNEQILTVSNNGKKSFTLLIENKNHKYDNFVWIFEDAGFGNTISNDIDENISMLFKDEDITTNDDENERMIKMMDFSTIDVPAEFTCPIKIRFYPKYVGLHFETLRLYFKSNNEIFDKRDVPMWAKATGLQIHLDPSFIDLGIIMMDSGIYQQNFNIVNTGRSSIEVSISIPKCVKNQIFLYPRSTFIQSESTYTVSVRFIPKSNIIKKSRRYYNPISNVLEIPIHIKSISMDTISAPPLILKIFSTLTTCHALILEPSHVDLGRVFTHESILAELTLTNVSLLIQEYGFINLPMFMEIQPNYGFGKILPGESILLHLIYSPSSIDTPDNELGANGLEGERSFLIQVVTIAELAAKRGKESLISKFNNSYVKRLKHYRRSSGFPFEIKIIDENECRILSTRNTEDLKEQFLRRCNITEDIKEDKEISFQDENAFIFESALSKTEIDKQVYKKDKRIEKNVIEVSVYIVDTYCELSEQILEFPGTPCGCFSIISIELRTFNMASYPNCSCGVLKDQTKDFTANYEFRSSSDRVSVVPGNGRLKSNELVKLNFIFEPKLSKYDVIRKTEELKIERIANELEKDKLAKTKQKNSKKSKTRNKKRLTGKEQLSKKEEDKHEISSNELFLGESNILENFEPYSTTIDITCLIEIKTSDGVSRKETLFAKLICPVIKPAIIILNNKREINFEPTIIGSSSRKFLMVKNISEREVKVRMTMLNPLGPFFIPSDGKIIQIGTILKLPITYRPTKNDPPRVQEFFEVAAVGTRTSWQMMVSGEATTPI